MTKTNTAKEPREPKTPRGHGGGMSTVNPVEAAGGGLALLLLPALMFMAAGPLVGWLFYLWCHAHEIQWLGVLWAASGTGLTFAIYDHTSARMEWEQRRLAIASGYAVVCWTWVILYGPSTVWFGVSEVLAVTGTLWWFLAKTDPWRGIGQDQHGGDGEFAKAVGLAETTRAKAKNSDDELRIRVTHTDNTHEDVDRSLPKVAAKAKGAVDGWVREPVTHRGKVLAHMSDLVYRRNSRMDDPGMWPGPDRPGDGIWLPIPYGVAADGALSCVQLTPNPPEGNFGSPAHGVAGQSGSGKTAFTRNVVGSVVARQGVMLWGADPSKAGNWVNFIRPALDWFEEEPAKVRAMLLAAKELVRVNTDILARQGMTTWEPRAWTEFGIPALLLWLEECQPYLEPLLEEIKQGVQVWRSAGVHVILSSQRPSESNMDTDIRSLVPEWLQFRCQRDTDAAMSLGHDLVDAGALPHKIPLRGQEGMHWAVLLNEDSTRWTMKRRTWQDDLEKLVLAVAEYAPRMARLHETARAAIWDLKVGNLDVGKAYRERERVGLREWGKGRWQQPFLLKPGIRDLIAAASELAAEEPPINPDDDPDPPTPNGGGAPAGTHTFRLPPPPRDDTTDTPATDRDPVYAADENVVDLDSDHAESIAEELETDRIDAEIDADVDAELGPTQEEDTVGQVDPDEIVAEAARGQQVPGLDYGDPNQEWAPAPTPKQRGMNFLAMIRRFLADDDLRQQAPDGTFWVVVDAERLVPAWLAFTGERPELRPSLYRMLAKYEQRALVRDLDRGVWAVSARVLDGTPLELGEDYDPADDEVSEEEMQALVDRLAV